MSDEKIYKAILDIMKECPAISKDQKNQQQGFSYRGIDVVMNVFQPLLAKHRVFVVPEVLDSKREERQTARGGNLIFTVLKMKYTFYAEDGSHVTAIVQGEGQDSGDKSSNKAMSVAFKYACFQVFCIPTEEMKDPDAETPPESVPKISVSQAKAFRVKKGKYKDYTLAEYLVADEGEFYQMMNLAQTPKEYKEMMQLVWEDAHSKVTA